MAIIKGVGVSNFRSLRQMELGNLSETSAITGLNNSGKSNLLRALNLFFNDEVEPGERVDLRRDCHSRSRKRRKEISVEIQFDLSGPFRFGKHFKAAEQLVGRAPKVRRTWSYDTRGGSTRTVSSFTIYDERADQFRELSEEEDARLRSFLGLMKYRYLPNHIHPSTIIDDEQEEIKRTLLARLRKSLSLRKGSGSTDVKGAFETLNRVASGVIQPIAQSMRKASEEIEQVELVTASGFEDVLFVFDYNVTVTGGAKVPGRLQGSGTQAHLMYELLHFLDTSFGERFGTRQAVVWGVEEPESFLHSKLEYYLAKFFQQATGSGRFQLLCTTHSDIFTRFASTGILVELNNGESACTVVSPRELVRMGPVKGISRFVHELLYENRPLVLVEGKTDVKYLDRGRHIQGAPYSWVVRCLAELLGREHKGGVEALVRYLKENRTAVESRPPDSPIICVVDWSVDPAKVNMLRDALAVHPTSVAWRPGESLANPELDRTFAGIERFLSTRAIREASASGLLDLRRPAVGDLPLSVVRTTLGRNKSSLADLLCGDAPDEDFDLIVQLVGEIDRVVGEAVTRGRTLGC